MTTRWPTTLWLVRHGQSAGNVALEQANVDGADRIALTGRDVDVPLSALGERQADALGRWFAGAVPADRPEILLCSPYVRAMTTAERFRAAGGTAGADVPLCLDERLREKEFGILDGLTRRGVARDEPQQAAFRAVLGKFYHRPPGGESWADVILRLRSLMDTMSLHYGGRTVMVVAHQVVVLCLRYVIENMTEQEILAIDAEGDVANCSVTEYRFDPNAGRFGNLVLSRYNTTAPIEAGRAPVTAAPDQAVAARG